MPLGAAIGSGGGLQTHALVALIVRDSSVPVGITRMSASSRTTVGRYGTHGVATNWQFDVCDDRSMTEVCVALRR